MKKLTLKSKVEKKLIKCGNNVSDVRDMINLHFEKAALLYTSPTTIAEYIRTIY